MLLIELPRASEIATDDSLVDRRSGNLQMQEGLQSVQILQETLM